MGSGLVKIVSELGGYLGDIEFKVLVRMALSSLDHDKPPVYFKGRADLAAGIRVHGRELDVATKAAVKRAVRGLRTKGLIVAGDGGHPGRVQVFALTLHSEKTAELRPDRPLTAYGKDPADWRLVPRSEGNWLQDGLESLVVHRRSSMGDTQRSPVGDTQRSPVGDTQRSPMGNVSCPQWGTSNVPPRNKGGTIEEEIEEEDAWAGTSPTAVDTFGVSELDVPREVDDELFIQASQFLQRRPDLMEDRILAARKAGPDLSSPSVAVRAAIDCGWNVPLNGEIS